MGMVGCPKHGRGFMYNCPHLISAVTNGSRCAGAVYREYAMSDDRSFRIGCWYCPACVEAHHLPPSGTVPFDSQQFPESVASLLQPMCPGCFQEWQAAGNG
jgi:hypothetical protein